MTRYLSLHSHQFKPGSLRLGPSELGLHLLEQHGPAIWPPAGPTSSREFYEASLEPWDQSPSPCAQAPKKVQ